MAAWSTAFLPSRPLRRIEHRRHRRSVRARTVPIKKLTRKIIADGAAKYPEVFDRPRTRADCIDGPRPCPYVACKYNLFLDINPDTGSIKFNFPDLAPSEMGDSCVLDAASRGGMTLDHIAIATNVSRERIRQLEEKILAELADDPGLEDCDLPQDDRRWEIHRSLH